MGETILVGPIGKVNTTSGNLVEPAADYVNSQFGADIADCVNQLLSANGDGTGETDHASVAPSTVSGVDGFAVITTSAAHNLLDNQYVIVENVGGATEVNIIGTVQNKTATTFTIQTPAGVDITSASAYTSGGTVSLCYVYKPASDEVGITRRINGYAHDGTYDSTGYLGVAALTNGIEVSLYRNTTKLGDVGAAPVKIWPQWACNAGVDIGNADSGAGQQTQTVLRWSFFKGCGLIRVDGSLDEFIAIIIRDDITGLLGQEMAIQGSIKAVT